MSRDMGNTITAGALAALTLAGVESSSGHHRRRRRGSLQAEVAREYALEGMGVSWWPATGRRATRRSSLGPGDRRRHRPRSRSDGRVDRRAPPPARPPGSGCRGRHDRAGTSNTTTRSGCRERRSTGPCAARAGHPDAGKRPRSSYIRFQAEQPNEMWQADFTHYRLADGVDVEILSLARRPRPPRPVGHRPPPRHRPHRRRHVPRRRRPPRLPASTLTDNGMVFTTRLAGGNGGRNGLRDRTRAASASPRRTPDPTTPPPAAKSNASNRR